MNENKQVLFARQGNNTLVIPRNEDIVSFLKTQADKAKGILDQGGIQAVTIELGTGVLAGIPWNDPATFDLDTRAQISTGELVHGVFDVGGANEILTKGEDSVQFTIGAGGEIAARFVSAYPGVTDHIYPADKAFGVKTLIQAAGRQQQQRKWTPEALVALRQKLDVPQTGLSKMLGMQSRTSVAHWEQYRGKDHARAQYRYPTQGHVNVLNLIEALVNKGNTLEEIAELTAFMQR